MQRWLQKKEYSVPLTVGDLRASTRQGKFTSINMEEGLESVASVGMTSVLKQGVASAPAGAANRIDSDTAVEVTSVLEPESATAPSVAMEEAMGSSATVNLDLHIVTVTLPMIPRHLHSQCLVS